MFRTEWKKLSYESFGVSSPFDSTCRLVTSPFFSPLVLGGLRLLFAVYTLATTITIFVLESVRYHTISSFLCYITNLSYIGLVAYFWVSGVHTILFASRGQKTYPLQSWPRILQLLHLLLYSTIIIFPIMVTLTFWSLLWDSSTFSTPFLAWYNISAHLINTILVLFEILLTNGPATPWIYILPLSLIYGFYLGVVYITYATQHFYVYYFFDPSMVHGLVPVYIAGTAVGFGITFIVVRSIYTLRDRFVARLGWGASSSSSSGVTTGTFNGWSDSDIEKAKPQQTQVPDETTPLLGN